MSAGLVTACRAALARLTAGLLGPAARPAPQPAGEVGVAAWRLDGGAERRLSWSGDAAATLGTSGPVETLEDLLRLVHPDDRSAARAGLERAFAGARPSQTLRLVAAGGAVRWCELRASVQRGPGGDVGAVCGVVVDVTELKEAAEQELRGAAAMLRAQAEAGSESAELYRTYFTASPVALFACGTDGRYREVNGAACALTGYSREELLCMSLADLLEPGGQSERLIGLLALGGGPSEVSMRRRDGSPRHCLVHATALGEDRLLGLLLDVTERREAEERLRESEERFRSLSEASLEAIVIHDAGRIVDVNQALCDLGGYSWHELVGRDAFEILAPEYREIAYRNLLAEHEGAYEVEAFRRDGRRMPLELQGRSFPHRGKVLRVVSVRDLTARRHDAAVRDSLVRELEARNVELDRFGHAVSHGLKGPLFTIKGFADHLEKDALAGRTDRIASDAAQIREAVDRVQQTLCRLEAFSDAARPVGPPTVVAVEELVREALRILGSRAKAPQVDVQLASPLPLLFGDRARLVRVFEQLLRHASQDAASGSARVRVESGETEDGKATLLIRDGAVQAGDGGFAALELPEARSDSLFDDLAVVRRVVESHGGRVWLDRSGEGATTVCLAMPQAPPAAGRAALVRGCDVPEPE